MKGLYAETLLVEGEPGMMMVGIFDGDPDEICVSFCPTSPSTEEQEYFDVDFEANYFDMDTNPRLSYCLPFSHSRCRMTDLNHGILARMESQKKDRGSNHLPFQALKRRFA